MIWDSGMARLGLGPANYLLCPVTLISKPTINKFISILINKESTQTLIAHAVTMMLRFGLVITACCAQAFYLYNPTISKSPFMQRHACDCMVVLLDTQPGVCTRGCKFNNIDIA